MVSRMWGKDIVFLQRRRHFLLASRFSRFPGSNFQFNWKLSFRRFSWFSPSGFPRVCTSIWAACLPVCNNYVSRIYIPSLILEFPSTASALFHAKLYRPENICLSSVITPHICSSSICGIETLAGLSITKGEEENTARRNILLCTVFPIRDILA